MINPTELESKLCDYLCENYAEYNFAVSDETTSANSILFYVNIDHPFHKEVEVTVHITVENQEVLVWHSDIDASPSHICKTLAKSVLTGNDKWTVSTAMGIISEALDELRRYALDPVIDYIEEQDEYRECIVAGEQPPETFNDPESGTEETEQAEYVIGRGFNIHKTYYWYW